MQQERQKGQKQQQQQERERREEPQLLLGPEQREKPGLGQIRASDARAGCGKRANAKWEVGAVRRVAAGKRRQRGLREGRAAVDGGWLWQGARKACEFQGNEKQ